MAMAEVGGVMDAQPSHNELKRFALSDPKLRSSRLPVLRGPIILTHESWTALRASGERKAGADSRAFVLGLQAREAPAVSRFSLCPSWERANCWHGTETSLRSKTDTGQPALRLTVLETPKCRPWNSWRNRSQLPSHSQSRFTKTGLPRQSHSRD